MLPLQIPSLECLRCGYVWRPRQPVVRLCPRCKSLRWNVAKIRRAQPSRRTEAPELLRQHRGEIVRLARKYHARRLRVFGSMVRGEATEESDVDLLLDRGPGWEPFDRFRLQDALEQLLDRKVDLTTESGLHPMVRAQVVHEAVAL